MTPPCPNPTERVAPVDRVTPAELRAFFRRVSVEDNYIGILAAGALQRDAALREIGR